MVEELAEGGAGLCASGLFAVYGIEGGVDPEADCRVVEAPGGDVLTEGEVVAEDDDVGGEEDEEADEGDGVGCDPEGHQGDHIVPVGRQQFVDGGGGAWLVLVLVKMCQSLGSDVFPHGCYLMLFLL